MQWVSGLTVRIELVQIETRIVRPVSLRVLQFPQYLYERLFVKPHSNGSFNWGTIRVEYLIRALSGYIYTLSLLNAWYDACVTINGCSPWSVLTESACHSV